MRGALLPCALVLLAGTATATAQDQGPEQMLVELRLGRLTSRTIPAFRSGDEALVPLFQFFDLAEIRTQPLADGGLVAILQPGNVRLTVLPQTRRLVLDGHARVLKPQDAVVKDGDVFLSTSVLAEVLTLVWQVSWSDLTVTVIDPASLPLARRLVREALVAARLAPPGIARPDWIVPLDRAGWDGFVLDYSVLAPSSDVLGGGAYSLGAGLDLLGGSLTGTLQTEGPVRDGMVRSDFAWQGVWRSNKVLSQMRLGDGISTGPRFRSLRGIAFGNSPFLRPTILGDLPYTGALGPGWKVEAYRGGRLIDFDSVNSLGQYRIDVPLQYGENPVDFIAFGPFGEMREFNRTYRVNAEILPRGRFEYAVSAGACRVETCTSTANVDLRYGVSRRWALSAGLDQFWRSSRPDLFHPYLSASGAVGTSVGIQVEAVKDAVLRGAVRFEPNNDVLLSAEATRYARGTVAPILTPDGRLNQFTVTGFFRPIRRFAALYLDGVLDRFESETGTTTSARIGGSFQRSNFRLLPSVRVLRQSGAAGSSRETVLGFNSIMLPMRRLGSFLGQIGVRLQVEALSSLRTRNAFVYLSRPILRSIRTEIGASWTRERGTTGSVFVALDLRTLRATTSAIIPPRGDVTATHFVSGAVLYDSQLRQVRFDAGPAGTRGGLAGRVFLDADDDGHYDPTEYVLPDVRVTVGISSARSNREGIYRIWNVNPFEPTLVSVDSTTLTSPLWVSGFGSVQIETGPNRYRPLNVPILMGGVIEGSVVRETSGTLESVPAAQITLRHLKTGAQRVLTTFSDGAFYGIGLRPGEYELTLHPSTAAALGVTSVPLRFTLPATLDGATVSNLLLRLR